MHMRDTLEWLNGSSGAHRVLLGIGYKAHYGAAIAALAHARLSVDQRHLIVHGNAERLLKLKPLHKKQVQPPNRLLENKPLCVGKVCPVICRQKNFLMSIVTDFRVTWFTIPSMPLPHQELKPGLAASARKMMKFRM